LRSQIHRLGIALLIGIAVGFSSGLSPFWPADFIQVLFPAEAVLRGMDPFIPLYSTYAPYPLTAALLGLPFTALSPLFGASLFAGIATAWLAYLLAGEALWPLLIFCSCPFFDALLSAQFTPFIVALALAGCAPLAVLIKPQNALPLLLTYRSRRWTFAVAGVILCGSLVVMPSWPWQWIVRLKSYEGGVWVLSWPGVLVLLAALCWEQPAARLLVFMACVPQRRMYDALALWLVPQTRSGMLTLTLLNWGASIAVGLLGNSEMAPFPASNNGRIMTCLLPALGVLLWEHRRATLARVHWLANLRTERRAV